MPFPTHKPDVGHYYSYAVAGATIRFYRHKTKSDAESHKNALKYYRPDKVGVTATRMTIFQLQQASKEFGLIMLPICVPE